MGDASLILGGLVFPRLGKSIILLALLARVFSHFRQEHLI